MAGLAALDLPYRYPGRRTGAWEGLTMTPRFLVIQDIASDERSFQTANRSMNQRPGRVKKKIENISVFGRAPNYELRRQVVPEGHLTIAQRFIAGNAVLVHEPSPIGTIEGGGVFDRPYGTRL